MFIENYIIVLNGLQRFSACQNPVFGGLKHVFWVCFKYKTLKISNSKNREIKGGGRFFWGILQNSVWGNARSKQFFVSAYFLIFVYSTVVGLPDTCSLSGHFLLCLRISVPFTLLKGYFLAR